ncbi:BamA/TamA family outer membrane protein [Draconibacterium sp. IB214405]|uniref:translocation and assembly module lipoprotein TamL n=1 Tax=Draconibacterium sp. IB214405 TaxID=3097352 RepID=UPI002A123B89|nr:BamA/TamA family outer membrane protein [Draconibacterium sp. IB214405]MDX8338708.1 BamA/TamA family outer membrane protein [Draconibacterium sp. IB214405]
MGNTNYKKSIVRFKWIAVLSAMLLASCSQTRFVSEQEYLLQKVELEIDNQNVSKEEAKAVLRQKENYKILGFIKFYLLLYNMSSKKKTDDWLKRIGEAPQIYDKVLADRSVEQLEQYMDQRGYYQAKIDQEIVFNEKKQKAVLKFLVESGDQYKIKRVDYHFETPELQAIFFNDSTKFRMRPGTAFDIYELEKQQQRIVNLYQNNGYYYFSKNQVRYLADTTLYEKQVNLDLFIGEAQASQIDSFRLLKPYYINKFYYSVMPGNTPVTANRQNSFNFSDTISWGNSVLYNNRQVSYPPGLFNRTNQMKSGDLYKVNEVESTFNALNRLRQFRFVDIQFNETYPEQDSNLLDCNIRLAPLNKQSTSFDIEGTNTSGNLGVAGNIYYQHRNMFKGAEVFQLRLKGATERMHRTTTDGGTEAFNTREFGVEGNLMIPKLLGPGKYIRSFGKYLPKTVFTAGFNYQRRPEYTRNITNFKVGYDWKTSQDFQHIWNFLDVNVVRLYEFDSTFINSIQDLYIKSSFTDHLIFAMNYSIIFNNQRLTSSKNYTYARLNVESSGNLLYSLSEIFNRDKLVEQDTITNETLEYYRFFNIRFAQYVKADIEFRRAIQIDRYNSVVGRAFAGVGLPYGNSRVLPYEKQYFAGGANGIRAWQVRSLGPGTYKPEEENAYPNQSSDIKLEANLEYRFRLLGSLEGALFLDAGNIWAINNNDNREGAQFKLNKFYKQFAVGTGTGFRFDLSYFILRTDVGMKLHDPAAAKGERWIIGNRGLTGDDFTFSFAIGYPF